MRHIPEDKLMEFLEKEFNYCDENEYRVYRDVLKTFLQANAVEIVEPNMGYREIVNGELSEETKKILGEAKTVQFSIKVKGTKK